MISLRPSRSQKISWQKSMTAPKLKRNLRLQSLTFISSSNHDSSTILASSKIKQGILAELYKEIEDYDRGVNRPRERRGGNLNFIDQYNEEVKELINKVVSNKKRIWDEKEQIQKKIGKISHELNQFLSRPRGPEQKNRSQVDHPIKKQQSNKRYQKEKQQVSQSEFRERQSGSSYKRRSSSIWNPTEGPYSFENSVKSLIDYESKHNPQTKASQLSSPTIQLQKELYELQEVNKTMKRQYEAQIQKLKKQVDRLVLQKNTKIQLVKSLQKDHQLISSQKNLLRSKLQLMQKQMDDQKTRQQHLSTAMQATHQRRINHNISSQFSYKELYSICKQTSQKEVQTDTNSSIQIQSACVDSHTTMLRLFPHSKILPCFPQIKTSIKIRSDLEKVFCRKIAKTQLLYAFDFINILHFKDYIQGRENVVVFIDLGNGTIVGGFAGQTDQQQRVSDTFLFSLRVQRPPIKLTTSSTINRINIDPNFINFGNGELKLTGQTLNFFTNVGGFSCSYYCERKRASILDFLGEEKREWKVKGYEIHEVFFDGA